MITEKMMEFVVLGSTMNGIDLKVLQETGWKVSDENGKVYDYKKMYNRFTELRDEFMKPYVIDNAEKSE